MSRFSSKYSLFSSSSTILPNSPALQTVNCVVYTPRYSELHALRPNILRSFVSLNHIILEYFSSLLPCLTLLRALAFSCFSSLSFLFCPSPWGPARQLYEESFLRSLNVTKFVVCPLKRRFSSHLLHCSVDVLFILIIISFPMLYHPSCTIGGL